MQGSRKLKNVKVTVDELREEDATRRLDGEDSLVKAIQEAAKAARVLLKGQLSEWAVITLISEASGVPKKTVARVLSAAESLEEKCLKQEKDKT